MMFEKQVDVMNQMVDSFISDNNERNEEFNNQVNKIVKLRQGSGKDRQGMAVKAKGLKA